MISNYLLWLWAIAFAAMPAIIALDFGGILPWTQYLASLVIVVGCSATIATTRYRPSSVGIGIPAKSFTLTGLLVALITYAAFQTIPLPQQCVAWLSPASLQAYANWCSPLIDSAGQLPVSISVAAFDSWHPIAFLTIIALLSFVVPVVYQERSRISCLLLVVTIGSTSIAIIGLLRKLLPGFHLWSFQEFGEGAPFGSFLNRNNAALAMNVGLATGFGLLLRQILVHTVDCREKSVSSRLNKLFRSRDAQRDPLVFLPSFGILVCTSGLVVCGSRGGLLSTVVAVAAVAIVYYSKRSPVSTLGVAAVLGLLLVAVVLRSDHPSTQIPGKTTFKQIESSVDVGTSRLAADTRLAHWPDGWRTALKHLPAGSGLSSYGYAYLPWQETSPWRHCAHADNLWLEMFVELGLPGVIFFACLAWLLVRSLKRLYQSPDPIDQGLWLAGFYCVIVLLVSQTFDFGLIAPANLVFVTLLLPVVYARSESVVVLQSTVQSTDGSVPSRPKLQLVQKAEFDPLSSRHRNQRILYGAAFLGLLIASFFGLSRLRHDCQVDFLTRTIQSDFDDARTSPNRLKRLANESEFVLQKHAAPDLMLALARVYFQIGRLSELSQMNFGRLPSDQQEEIYASTSRIRRRLGWRKSLPRFASSVTHMGNPVQAMAMPSSLLSDDAAYGKSFRLAKQALILRPLEIESRMNFVYLEFVHQSEDTTRLAIQHCSDLFRNTPELQLRLGAVAADQGDYSLAVHSWKRATDSTPTMIRRTVHRAIRYPEFPINQIIPESSSGRSKAEQVLRDSGFNI